MNTEELKEKVMELIDANCSDMDKREYSEFLGDLISDLEIRLEANEEELEDM